LSTCTIREARVEELEALSALCLRSKAHWGYDADFMARCVPVMRLTPERIEGRHRVAEADGRAAGFALLAPLKDGRVDLDLFFVEPKYIGSGVGRALFASIVDLARSLGFKIIEIVADPNAEGFYSRLGAVRVGVAESEVDPGRHLPMLELAL
jgi:GNAT superfamily N-acetyltransferase